MQSVMMRTALGLGLAALLSALPAAAQSMPQRGTNFPYMMLKPRGMPGPARPYTQAPPMPPAQRQPFVLGQGGRLTREFGTASRPGWLGSVFGRATRR
ncbi:hypothetical protein CR165_22335 [Pseudoroseomonas aestuarii]|uniref:Transporter n=2 Tax=Teichococcus aestuarii TaxID=568898 RepID=A0A2U1UY61_9PROT|nr:hypothetical protein CR165_22335 [Pseudoroseomonas aestuarii]